MLFTVPFDNFGGLDLRDASNETSGALDLLNVEFDRPGRIRSRDGYTQFAVTGSAEAAYQLVEFEESTGTSQFLMSWRSTAAHANKVTAFDTSGTGLATASLSAAGSFVRFGTPTAEYVYTLDGSTTWQRWDGAAFSARAGMPNAWYATVSPNDNRLVAARTANVNRVQFSDPGAPETFGANNYVDLTPGDGEPITGTTTWRNLVFVFKASKFFVFYGTSTDTSGNPVFNYRTVQATGAYASATLIRPLVAGNEGVYFFDGRSIWLTTGGVPQRVSEAIDPYLQRATLPLFSSATGLSASAVFSSVHLSYVLGRLYVQMPAASGNTTFVYDPLTAQWTLFDLPLRMAIALRISTDLKEMLFLSATDFKVYRYGSAYTTDNGTSITSRYRSPFIPLDWRGRNLRSGIHGVDKTVRESMIEGTGNVSYALTNQWATTIPTAASLTLGTSPAVAEARDRRSVRGRMFSFQLSGTSPWEVQTVSWNIYSYQAAGEQSEAA